MADLFFTDSGPRDGEPLLLVHGWGSDHRTWDGVAFPGHRVVDVDLRGQEQPGAEFLTRVGANNMARLQAEEIVLQEMVLLPAETSDEDEDSDEMPPQWRIPTAQETATAVIASEERTAH